MIFSWYKIINRTEYLATGLVSRVLSLLLEGIGLKNVMITYGNLVSLVYDDVMLPIGMSGENPFVFGGYAVYLDENQDIWLGVEINEG